MKKVIGITGTIASGKNVVRDLIKKNFSSYTVSLSSILQDEIEKKRPDFNRRNLQDLGNELRKKYGNEILAKLAVEYMQTDRDVLIIDGIRNPGEVEFLRKKFGEKFILIGVDAPKEIRFKRILKRSKQTDPKTWEEFLSIDERDQGRGEPTYGQQTRKCLEMADFLILNDSSLENLEKKVNEIILKIKD